MKPIGHSVTHFAPAIEFLEADFVLANAMARGRAHVCRLGLPPDKLQPVHTPALINAWDAKLRRCLAQPTQVEQGEGFRRVQVLGLAIFDFDADGTVSTYVWAFEDGEGPVPVQVVDISVIAQDVPYQSYWMNGFKSGALRWLKQHHPEQPDLCEAYVDWAHDELVRQCWEASDQTRVRERVGMALAMDPLLLEIAGRIQLGPHQRAPARLNAYNHVVTYRADYLILWREAPNLITLYALLAEDIQPPLGSHVEVTDRMRRYLTNGFGLSPAFWRLLCREGTAWMPPFLAYYDFDSAPPARAVEDLLCLAQAFGTDTLVPPWWLHALMSVGGNPNRPGFDYRNRLGDLLELCHRLGLLTARADASVLGVLEENATEILQWASDHLGSMSDSFIRRLSVAGLLKRVRLQLEQDRVRATQQMAWEVPYTLEPPCLGIQAVILDSALAVWQEAHDMRHCAARYIDECATGEVLMVSLRRCTGGKALATAAFDMRSPQVELKRISGFANTLVEPEVRSWADACARQLQPQRMHQREKHLVAEQIRTARQE